MPIFRFAFGWAEGELAGGQERGLELQKKRVQRVRRATGWKSGDALARDFKHWRILATNLGHAALGAVMTEQVDLQPTEEVLARYPGDARHLISVLQDIQLTYRYLPREALDRVSIALGVPIAKIYAVATFYKAFSLTPRGEKVLRVCTGTACHIRGAPLLLTELEKLLDVKAGQTTEDLQFSLEAVNCVGACALAPVVVVNETAHGNLSVTKVRRLTKTKGNKVANKKAAAKDAN